MKSQFIQEKIASAESIGKRVNVCADLFEQLEKEKKPGSALKQIVQIAEDTWFSQSQQTDSTSASLSDMLISILNRHEEDKPVDESEAESNAEMKFLISRHRNLAQAIIDLNCDKGYNEIEYYEKIWNHLSLMLSSASENEKGACLYAFLLDRRTPYFEVKPGIQMKDWDYKKELEQLSKELDMARFILNLNNKQKTETASQLFDLIDQLDSKVKKVVLLSRIITMVQREKRDDDDAD